MNARKTGLPGLASCTGSGLKWSPVPRTGGLRGEPGQLAEVDAAMEPDHETGKSIRWRHGRRGRTVAAMEPGREDRGDCAHQW